MKQLDAKSAQALAEIRAHPAYRVFVEWLKEDEKLETQRALTLDGPPGYRAAGAALKLRELQSEFDLAPSVAEKIKRQTG